MLLGICKGIAEGARGSIISGYACEEIATWFYKDAIPILSKRNYLLRKKRTRLQRSGLVLFEKIKEELAAYQERHQQRAGTEISMVLCDAKRYYCFWIGQGKRFRLRRGMLAIPKQKTGYFAKKRKRQAIIKSSKVNFQTGKRKKKEGFLICSDNFLRKLKSENILKTLQADTKITGERIGRILTEIGKRSFQRGETDSIVAIYCQSNDTKMRREDAKEKKYKDDKTRDSITRKIFGRRLYRKWWKR